MRAYDLGFGGLGFQLYSSIVRMVQGSRSVISECCILQVGICALDHNAFWGFATESLASCGFWSFLISLSTRKTFLCMPST